MTKRRFPLAAVLRVRRLQERAAQVEAAQSSQIAYEALSAAVAREKQARASAFAGTADGRTFVAAMAASRALAVTAAACQQVALDTQADADQAASRQRLATQRVKGLERLEERHRADVQAEQDRLATAEADDLVSGRHAVTRARDRQDDPKDSQ